MLSESIKNSSQNGSTSLLNTTKWFFKFTVLPVSFKNQASESSEFGRTKFRLGKNVQGFNTV